MTRGVVIYLDPTPAQERLLKSYCGAARVAHNWAVEEVFENLRVRSEERKAGVPEEELTPSLSWSQYSLELAWNAAKATVAPWHKDVSAHAFYSGISSAANAFGNYSLSKKGTRAGSRVGIPRRKSRNHSKLSVTFRELKRQSSWFRSDGHAMALLLPRNPDDPSISRRRDQLKWIHTTKSTRRLARKVAEGSARIQRVTISFTGGAWQAAFSVRYLVKPTPKPVKHHGGVIGIDLGISHLATLSRPVKGLTDAAGHIANPRHIEAQLRRLARLDRAIARATKGSKNHAKLKARRAKLYGRIAKTRAGVLHALTTLLAGGFDTVGIEDLNVAGMSSKKRRLGRALADASLSELRRQLGYKTAERGSTLIAIDRFFPSTKMCSSCKLVKATLALSTRTFECDSCDLVLDRDVNAAINIEQEALRLLVLLEAENTESSNHVARIRPETLNAESRTKETASSYDDNASAAIRPEPRSHDRELTLST